MWARQLLNRQAAVAQLAAECSQRMVGPWWGWGPVRHMAGSKSPWGRDRLTNTDKKTIIDSKRTRRLLDAADVVKYGNAVPPPPAAAAVVEPSQPTTSTGVAAEQTPSTATVSPLQSLAAPQQQWQQQGDAAADSSSPSSSSADTSSSSSSSTTPSKEEEGMAKWLTNIFGGTRRAGWGRKQDAPASVSPLHSTRAGLNTTSSQLLEQQKKQQEVAKTMAESTEEDWVKQFRQYRNMSMNEYLQMVQTSVNSQFKGQPAPRVPRRHDMDQQHIMYCFLRQQQTIITTMSVEEKKYVKDDPDAALRDTAFLKTIAKAVQLKPIHVISCIQQYRKRRASINAVNEMLDAGVQPHLEGGMQQLEREVASWQRRRTQERLSELLKKRDPKRCTIKPWLDPLGLKVTCPRTQLSYRECCGALHA